MFEEWEDEGVKAPSSLSMVSPSPHLISEKRDNSLKR